MIRKDGPCCRFGFPLGREVKICEFGYCRAPTSGLGLVDHKPTHIRALFVWSHSEQLRIPTDKGLGRLW